MIKVDMNTLLLPVEEDLPTGYCIEYEPVYDEIRNARENDPDYICHGVWAVSEPRRADWQKVARLCEHVLLNKSKDLQVCCWYVEALTRLTGLSGMQDGLKFLAKFITLFWSKCWPSAEEGNEVRYSKLERLDLELSCFIKQFPILENKEITHSNWYKALAFEHNVSLSVERREQLIATEGDNSVEVFKRHVTQYDIHNISNQIKQFTDLNKIIDEVEACYFFHTHEEIHKIFIKTRQVINEVTDLLNHFLPQQKTNQISEPIISAEFDPQPIKENVCLRENTILFTKLPMTRDKAIEELENIAHFFRKTEPTSPVPYLLERAVRWSNMSMSEWLEELLKDKESMEHINRILKG